MHDSPLRSMRIPIPQFLLGETGTDNEGIVARKRLAHPHKAVSKNCHFEVVCSIWLDEMR